MSDMATAGIGCRFARDADEQVAKYLDVVASAAFPQPGHTGRVTRTSVRDAARLARVRAELSAMDRDARGPAVTRMLVAELAEIMRVAPESIDSTVPVSDLGLDSLMAVELGARISRSLGIELVSLQTGRSFSLDQAGPKVAELILADAEPAPAGATSHEQEVCR